jgi:hypothetical protein
VNWLRRRRIKFNLNNEKRVLNGETLHKKEGRPEAPRIENDLPKMETEDLHKRRVLNGETLHEEGNLDARNLLEEIQGEKIQGERKRCMATFLGIGNEMRKTRKADISVLKIAMPISNLKFEKST